MNNNTFEHNGIVYKVCKVTPTIQLESNKYYAKALNYALDNAYPLKIELKKLLEDKGLFNLEQKEKEKLSLRKEIKDLEIKLRKGVLDGKRMSKEVGRDIAIKIKKLRNKLSSVDAEINGFLNDSAENYAENERIQYWMHACIVNAETGDHLWPTFENLKSETDEELLKKASAAFFNALFSLDTNYEMSLYENKWLIKMGFMNDKFQYIRHDGRLIDEEGRLIDEEGRFVNENGDFVDIFGNPVDKDGNLLVEDTWGVLDSPKVASETKTAVNEANSKQPV
jgi:hypothetical protein